MTSTETAPGVDAFEEFPLDFNAYLGKRLGIERDAALVAVGRWLEHYESAASRPGLATRRSRRSGVFPSPGTQEAPATGTTHAA